MHLPKISTSDHKPVYATFNVPVLSLSDAYDPSLGPCTLNVRKLKGKDLPAADVGGSSDPYVEFHGVFVVGNHQKTTIRQKTLTPEWPDKEVPTIPLTINNRNRLQDSFLLIHVYDYDRAARNDLLGSCVLPLKSAVEGKGPVKFDLVLSHHGLPAGSLSGELELTWAKSVVKPMVRPSTINSTSSTLSSPDSSSPSPTTSPTSTPSKEKIPTTP